MVKSGEVIWEQPKENPKSTGRPSPRSGHTITCLNEKAYFFGGCGVENGAPSVFNDMYLLHISEQFRFQKIDALGDVPSPRWRHTATLLPDNNSIFVFGGLCKGKRYNDSHIFDVARQEWRPAEVAGTPPHPRSHHTATLVEFDEEEDGDAEKKVFIIGGYGGHGSSRDFSMDVHAFDLDHWTWSAITRIKGPAPKPRGDHTVSVAGNLLILSGGRGSSTSKPAFSGYFDDVHVLDLGKQEWIRPPGLGEGDSLPMWPGLPSGTLWNHAALCVESVPSFRMFVFGGQKAEFSYSDELHILDTGRMQFTQVNFAPEGKERPSAREDCGIAYDTKSCRLVFFGGWKQGWMDDLWCLNVAGVVGPPYAVQSIGPTTGPITGNTPISIHGIGFIDGKQWDVRFTDGRREATVPGKFISPTELQCNTPSFEKFGPLEVMVRVAIKGDPFTVNKAMFTFFVNTKAAKCMAFGPGLLPTAGKAGRKVAFIMQAKDSTGKMRTSGDDAIKVHVGTTPALLEAVPVHIHDFKDGNYKITYQPPTTGKYEIAVTLDENAFDTDDTYLHIRGSPFTVSIEDSWKESAVAGAAPAAKDRVKVWAIGKKLYVLPEPKFPSG